MSNITVFGGSTNVPAFVRSAAPGNLADVSTAGTFAYISLKGKVFTKRDGDTKTLITKPGTDGEPANALEVVILDVGPSADKKVNCKVWYANGYEEGSTAKPDCFSDDGISPAASSKSPQHSKCALCPKNVWGSGNNGQGTECSSSKRLAIATPDNLDEPMLLRVPAGSLTGLGEYFKWMKQSGIQDSAFVVTRIGFDYTVAHQKLTFKGMGWAQKDPTEAKNSDVVAMIVGKKPMVVEEAGEPFEQGRPAFADKPVEPPTEKPTKAPKAAPVEDDDLPTTPKVKTEVKVEAAKKPEPKAETVVAADADLEDALDDLDFDD